MKILGSMLLVMALLNAGELRAQGVSAAPITVGESLDFYSEHLGETRLIRVSMPPSYGGSMRHYPVIYVLDGEGAFLHTTGAVRFMTTYSELPQMPEALVVAVHNTDRNRDMPIPQRYGVGGEEDFLTFLADELIPFIDQRYRTHPLRILIGHSQGGLFATYAMAARPDAFSWYLTIDAPLFGPGEVLMDQAVSLVSNNPSYRGRLVSVERQLGWMRHWPKLAEAAPPGAMAARLVIEDETHETMAYKAVYEGLQRLFDDYLPARRDATLAELEAVYAVLSEAYGYPVEIPQQVLLASADRNAGLRRGEEAIELVQRAEDRYGASERTQRLMARAKEAAEKTPDPIVEELLNTPPPSAEAMASFLGVWEGRLEVPGGVPMDITLTFAMDGSVVRGRQVAQGPGGFSMKSDVEVMRVLEEGVLQWARAAGRSGGMVVSTGRLGDVNTLQGAEELRGIDPPPGITMPPPNTFTFHRKAGSG